MKIKSGKYYFLIDNSMGRGWRGEREWEWEREREREREWEKERERAEGREGEGRGEGGGHVIELTFVYCCCYSSLQIFILLSK